MKNFMFKIMLLPIALLAACNNKNQQATGFIPGIYVNQAQSEYSIANDTLVITAMSGPGYHVLRKTGFRRITNGQMQGAEHRSGTFTGIWDNQRQTLQLTQNGLIIVFQPDSSQLMVQNSRYRKIGLPGKGPGL
jgi:hypothetical protein